MSMQPGFRPRLNLAAVSQATLPASYRTPWVSIRTMQQVTDAVQGWLKKQNTSQLQINVLESGASKSDLLSHLKQSCMPDISAYEHLVHVTATKMFEYGGLYHRRWIMNRMDYIILARSCDLLLGDVNGIDSHVTLDFKELETEVLMDPYQIAAIVESIGPGEAPEWVDTALSGSATLRMSGSRRTRDMDDSEASIGYKRQQALRKGVTKSDEDEEHDETEDSDDDDEEDDEHDVKYDDQKEQTVLNNGYYFQSQNAHNPNDADSTSLSSLSSGVSTSQVSFQLSSPISANGSSSNSSDHVSNQLLFSSPLSSGDGPYLIASPSLAGTSLAVNALKKSRTHTSEITPGTSGRKRLCRTKHASSTPFSPFSLRSGYEDDYDV